MLQDQLQALDIDKKFFPRFQEVFKTCWKNNGDNLSWIYAGSGAQHKSSKVGAAHPIVYANKCLQ